VKEIEEQKKEESKEGDFLNMEGDGEFHHLETEVVLSTGKGQFSAFIAKVFGTEIYFYRKSAMANHEFMHTLVGTFVNISDHEQVDGENKLYPISIALPPKYTRTVYFLSTEDQTKWLAILR
jgi:hypothetical protein